MTTIVVEKTTTTTVPPGKIKCYVTGKLRKDTPEEHVRQRMARSLVEEYGYRKEDMALEWVVQMGVQKKKADIVIFKEGCPHTPLNVRIIVEAKRDSIKPRHADQGIAQLHSYLSASPNAEFGHWVGSESRSYRREVEEGEIKFLDALDLPLAGGKSFTPISFSALVPATDVLKDVFKRCHNYIAANQGGSKESAFHEFLKVTFCKVFDEKFSSQPEFFVAPSEQKTTAGQMAVTDRIAGLFTKVCEQYGYIFGDSDKVNLKPSVVVYIVAELQKYSLLDTDFDYKGQAYEEIVGANSRGERGEFFTPRNLCFLAVDMIIEVVGIDGLMKSKVLDPACGTGGFLRAYIHRLFDLLLKQEILKWGDNAKAREKAKELLKSLCDQNVNGIDFNPVLVRAAQMNLVMHGDGSSNIFHENALVGWGEWDDATRLKLKEGTLDIIITNPPFGEDLLVDDPHILGQFALSTYEAKHARPSMAPQELFIERCHRLLKPSGWLAIVTPDNILSNPSYRFMRRWIVTHYEIHSSVSLPGEMFQPSTGTQTSLLLLRKRATPFKTVDALRKVSSTEPLFMSVPRKIGHDQRGSFIPRRDDDGDVVVQEITKKRFLRDPGGNWIEEEYVVTEPVASDDLPAVLDQFIEWRDELEVAK